MPYVIHALDRSDAGDLRARTRPEHLAYVGGFDLLYGGPLLDDDGEATGALTLLDAPDRAGADDDDVGGMIGCRHGVKLFRNAGR